MSRVLIKVSKEQKRYTSFKCNPVECEKSESFCCRAYSAVISEYESELIAKLIPDIRRLFSLGPERLPSHPFTRIDDDTFEIDHSPSTGACIFLAYDDEDTPICLIHAVCESLGLDYRLYKPLGCCMFPLEVVEDTDNEKVCIIHRDYSRLPCLKEFSQVESKSLLDLAKHELEANDTSFDYLIEE